MHIGHLTCLLLVLTPVGAFAQPDQKKQESGALATTPPQRSAEDTKAIKERVSEWFKTCLEDWDQTTHMTKKEWRTTCRRVAAERGRFLLETPDMDLTRVNRARAR
jgi:hypothetical protein